METSRRLFPCLFPRWAKSFLMFLGFLFLLSKPISPCEASSPLKLAGGASGHAFCVYHPSKLQFVCWGQNDYGQLGYPDTQNRGLTQRADALPIIDLLDHFPEKNGTSLELLLPAYWNNGVLFSDGSAVLFGSDGYGQIGVNSPAPFVLLQDASLSTETFKVLAGAGVANCFATTEEPSDMICWGDDWAGGGDLRAGEGEVEQVVAGYKYVCALYQSTKTFCWGTPGAYNDKIQGEVVFGGGLYATKLFAGSAHMCAIVNDGSSRCWSYGHTGQLGYGGFDSIDDSPGHEVSSLGPIQFQDADPYSVQSMCGGVYHSCALLADHSVWCWGRDSEVGTDSAVNLYNPIPLLVEFSVDQSVQAQQLECSDKATCVLFNDSSVRCWGGNSYGELGSGSVGIRSAFFAIPLDFTELVSSSSSASSSEGDPSSSSSEVPSGSDSSSSSSDGEAVALSVTFAPNSTSYTIIASADNQDEDLEAMEVTAHFDSFVMEDHVLLLSGSWKDKGSEVDEEDGSVHHEVWVGVANSNSTLLITHHDVKKAKEQETLPGSGRSFAVGPSVKTSLRMDGWPFNFTTTPASSWTWTMSLQVPFSHRLIGFECKSIGESVEECLAASLVEGWTVRVKVVLEALVDGQPNAVTYHILPQSNSSAGADVQVVEIQFHLPAFQQSLFYDPDLSVLLQTGGAKGDDEEGKEKEEDPNLVVVYVLVPLFVGAVVVLAAVVSTILLRRKRARNKAHVQEKLSAGLASSI